MRGKNLTRLAIVLMLFGPSKVALAESDDIESFPGITIRDSATGIMAQEYGQGVVRGLSPEAKTIWQVSVFAECGPAKVGHQKIRDIRIFDGKVAVTYGKHNSAVLDIRSGKTITCGAD